MNDLIFLDTETTGLDDNIHEVWQIAWAINDGPVQERILVHSLKTADPKALEMNHYYFEKYPEGARSEGPMVDLGVREALSGNTLVCANPSFDRGFLKKRWGVQPWHYRSIDLESMALLFFGYARPKGLKDIAVDVRNIGYDIQEPNHSAYQDVVVLRQCYKALRAEQKKRIDAYSRKVY